MKKSALGKFYQDGENIIRQGEKGDCMYIIQEGQVEVLSEKDGHEVRVGLLGAGDFFGEMAIFEKEVRSATVRSVGHSRVLTIDKKNLLRRAHEDPSLMFHMIKTMSSRIRKLDEELARIKKLTDVLD